MTVANQVERIINPIPIHKILFVLLWTQTSRNSTQISRVVVL